MLNCKNRIDHACHTNVDADHHDIQLEAKFMYKISIFVKICKSKFVKDLFSQKWRKTNFYLSAKDHKELEIKTR